MAGVVGENISVPAPFFTKLMVCPPAVVALAYCSVAPVPTSTVVVWVDRLPVNVSIATSVTFAPRLTVSVRLPVGVSVVKVVLKPVPEVARSRTIAESAVRFTAFDKTGTSLASRSVPPPSATVLPLGPIALTLPATSEPEVIVVRPV